jgi:hypothetical protein
LKTSRSSGWFDRLADWGALSAEELLARTAQAEFLRYVETGAYTKSYKLITLQVLVNQSKLRTGMPLRELALACRWEIFRDPRLLADLDDASSAFSNPAQPTEQEWLRYWMQNPIRALTTGAANDGQPFFTIEHDSLVPLFTLDDELGATFEAMVAELVEYRLHRYLAGRDAARQGEVRKPVDAIGRELDAGFVVSGLLGKPTSVLFESAGGARDDSKKRNPDYLQGLDVVLARLRELGVTVLDAYVDSREARSLPITDRRVDPGDGLSYPLGLAEVDDLVALRTAWLRSMARVGRDPAAKGGGNQRKALRLVIEGGPMTSIAGFADLVAHGSLGELVLSGESGTGSGSS